MKFNEKEIELINLFRKADATDPIKVVKMWLSECPAITVHTIKGIGPEAGKKQCCDCERVYNEGEDYRDENNHEPGCVGVITKKINYIIEREFE